MAKAILLLQGLRVFVASNASRPASAAGSFAAAAEGWAVVGNDVPQRVDGDPGASRLALAPFLALQQLGPTFKWAFVGTPDAQSAFSPAAAAHLVEGLDYSVPYLLTGKDCYFVTCDL